MQQKKISLNSIDKIKTMQDVLREYNIDADIKHELSVVDAKSFMGVMSLDLTRPVALVLHTDDRHMGNTIFSRLEDLWA